MKLTLGFSPCPNDTFIFDALVNNGIDTGDLEFEVYMEDVQTLNGWARIGKLDVSKISYGVLPLVLSSYRVLNSGGALGQGVGPLLIARSEIPRLNDHINELTVAIPGENTTAHMLFSRAFPAAAKKRFLVFNEVEDAVLNGDVDAGVIIHENRFTYHERGLVKLLDLGAFWETETGLPIPLGGIVIRKELPEAIQQRVDSLIQLSLAGSFRNYPELSAFIQRHSQEMSTDVMRKHIDLYVNDFSMSLGEKGKLAVIKVLETFRHPVDMNIFVPNGIGQQG
ncbi:1,4-dihydroxy-6-naphthoate synthase [Segetibacter sp. 3557_3]|uniref:1,4-dihydroxy-6-naphthoate synthase n=1 Tax=Segetibacter sp. 3557_3 TaxID=2547429 RepID=UPI001058A687|nr:1,4-dihydroxy-6-naphthoate synthase [Segetibacter sp. 3557_3]TDH18278.1 1,4-dihydroxy-6-naphthoate synthase [Segetibacter sp. 3557_3]